MLIRKEEKSFENYDENVRNLIKACSESVADSPAVMFFQPDKSVSAIVINPAIVRIMTDKERRQVIESAITMMATTINIPILNCSWVDGRIVTDDNGENPRLVGTGMYNHSVAENIFDRSATYQNAMDGLAECAEILLNGAVAVLEKGIDSDLANT